MSDSIEHIKKLLEEVELSDSQRAAIDKELKLINKKIRRKSFALDRLQIDHQIIDRFLNLTIQELEEKNQQLEKYIASNLQLENFAHIASHDLKAPLNNIVSFSKLLKRRSWDDLDEDSQDFINYIVTAASNMQDTIKALFKFSQASSTKIKRTNFSPKELLIDLKQDISNTLNDKKANLQIKELPAQVNADPILIREVFQNLILNGVKFVSKGIEPFLEVSGIENEQYWEFAVKDNGIGIEEEFTEKVFLVFRRLNGKQEYEGTGIGLSICKTIIDHHGGKIWIDSKPNHGSIFHFSIQKT